MLYLRPFPSDFLIDYPGLRPLGGSKAVDRFTIQVWLRIDDLAGFDEELDEFKREAILEKIQTVAISLSEG